MSSIIKTHKYKNRFLISPWLKRIARGKIPFHIGHDNTIVHDASDEIVYNLNMDRDYFFITFFDGDTGEAILTELVSPSTDINKYKEVLAKDSNFLTYLKAYL